MSCTGPEHVWLGGMALEHLCLASVQVDLCSFLLCWLIHLAVGEGWRQKRNFLLENPSPVNGWDSPALSHTHTPQRHLENGRGPLPMTALNQGSTCGPGATCTAQVGVGSQGAPRSTVHFCFYLLDKLLPLTSMPMAYNKVFKSDVFSLPG